MFGHIYFNHILDQIEEPLFLRKNLIWRCISMCEKNASEDEYTQIPFIQKLVDGPEIHLQTLFFNILCQVLPSSSFFVFLKSSKKKSINPYNDFTSASYNIGFLSSIS